ncbi:uncharacterized protein jumu [Euwallacea similis]|uniref:uncharacterized protein jumu n=1 Tax=Euwallacea similis TaxID=1736056 RepID=UPI00344DC659
MTTAMDIFLNASDSLPFPDVLDIDIKSDMDMLVGGHNDFSGFNFNSLEPLDFGDSHEAKWFNSNSNHSILDFSGDDGPTMVNPNAVLPVMSLASSIGRSPSPALRESHLTFSPATIKIASIRGDASVAKKDLLNRLEGRETIAKKKPQPATTAVIKSISKATPILAKTSLKPLAIRTSQSNSTILIKNLNSVTTPVITQVSGGSMTIRTLPTTMISQTIQRKSVTPAQKPMDSNDFKVYPKPAYSYSCLIAMALKNSRAGSLPVSEIYNFMCKHFPYFKTAPSGWKNSVRHNLSLNKCFEKIEKPALNGQQRKGCLWAMNPAKISKMDEEVQKWSRKDPSAIRKAMVNPENLESLERGEIKFSCSYDDECEQYGDSCGSVESGEGSDSDIDMQAEDMEAEETEIDVGIIQYFQVKSGQTEFEEVKGPVYEDDLEEDKELLRAEMALAQKELEFERTASNKRRRTFICQAD